MKQKMVLLADANSLWTKRYIERVILPLNIEITVLTNSNTNINNKAFYDCNGIKVISFFDNTWYGRIPKIKSFIANRKIKKILESEQFDYIVVLYVFDSIAKVLAKARFAGELIVTYIGSDLLRNKSNVHCSEIQLLDKAKHIVVMTSDMKRTFIKRFGNEYDDITRVIDMGVSAFGEINKKRDKINDCKQQIAGKENADKRIVTIGYNASDQQQHLEVMKSLNVLSAKEKGNIHIVLPLTYRNHNPEYIKHLKEYVISSGFSYTFLESFMNDTEIATLCIATDIFINAQTTDALSSSMLEHIYAGTYIINAEWLKYQPLEDMQIVCDQFREFSEIPDKVRDFGFSDGSRTAEYIKKMDEYCSWESCAMSWKKDVFCI